MTLCSFGVRFAAVIGVIGWLSGGAALAVELTATVSGSATPTTFVGSGSIDNGDLIQYCNPGDQPCGDALNEHTVWGFDFTADSDWPSLSSGLQVTVATLTLDIRTPFSGQFRNDPLWLNPSTEHDWFGLPAGQVWFDPAATVEVFVIEDVFSLSNGSLNPGETVDLLDHLSAGEMTDLLLSGEAGKIGAWMGGDVLIYGAVLTLTVQPVPTPASAAPVVLLGALGMAAIAALKRSKR